MFPETEFPGTNVPPEQTRETVNLPVPLRPHHGMCLAFFAGNGYSSGFTANMTRVKAFLEETDPAIKLVTGADRICAACPNDFSGTCTSAAKVIRYDESVLSLTGSKAGSELSFRSFSSLVKRHILDTGKREDICGDCQWNALCR